MAETSRRDFLFISAAVFPAVGLAISLWPVLSQMNPDANTIAFATTEVDLSPIALGQGIAVQWRGKPVFVRRRTIEEIEAARSTRWHDFRDPNARNIGVEENARPTDENRTIPGHGEWLVVIGVCTHAGCVLTGNKLTEARGDYGGWQCPCDYSMYDTSGRVRRGPATTNLAVPPYRFITDKRIVIG